MEEVLDRLASASVKRGPSEAWWAERCRSGAVVSHEVVSFRVWYRKFRVAGDAVSGKGSAARVRRARVARFLGRALPARDALLTGTAFQGELKKGSWSSGLCGGLLLDRSSWPGVWLVRLEFAGKEEGSRARRFSAAVGATPPTAAPLWASSFRSCGRQKGLLRGERERSPHDAAAFP